MNPLNVAKRSNDKSCQKVRWRDDNDFPEKGESLTRDQRKIQLMVIIRGIRYGNLSSNLDEADCISRSTNPFGKGINPTVLSPAMDIL